MGWFDYVSDVYSSFSIQGASADIQNSMEKASGDFNDGKDQTALGTAQQTRGASVRGGVSTNVPHSGTDEESESEKEVNEQDVKSSSPSEPGHVPGSDEAKTAAGQVGKENAGPHGGPVGPDSEANTGDEADEDEDEDDDEPVDPKIKIEADCEKTPACAPHKHHYDHCVERVSAQHEEHGKAHEDCVEEFFHLAHCVTQCAAPKLFKALR